MSTKTTPATKSDKLNSLYKECGLVKEDVFQHQHYTILARTGIEKVQAHYKITVRYKALKLEPEYVVIKATATMGEARVETYGSAVKANCKNSYFAETAEKRALSRAVLKLTGLYQHGFFGEEESEQLTADAKQAKQSAATNDEAQAIEHYLRLIKGARSKAGLREIWDSIPNELWDTLKRDSREAAARIEADVAAAATSPAP